MASLAALVIGLATQVPVATGTAPITQESTFSIDGGFQSGNRWGIRGAEALGGNWSAVFVAEAGFTADTGSLQENRLFRRQVWAGLEHRAFGTLAMGRIATPSSGTGSFDLFGAVDPFQTGWGIFGLQGTFIPVNSLREDNSIAWASPSWAGFKFGAQYSFNVDLGENSPSAANTTAFNLGANWSWGPLFLAATYDVINYADCYGTFTAGTCTTAGNRANAGKPDQGMLQIGGSFDFKFLKIHGAYGDFSDVSTISTVGGASNLVSGTLVPAGIGNYNYTAWMLGVSMPLFGGTLAASYQLADASNIIVGLSSFEPDYNVWGIGYSYPFSRRTNMYVGYGQRSWDGEVRSASGALNTSAPNVFDRTQFALGIRHLF